MSDQDKCEHADIRETKTTDRRETGIVTTVRHTCATCGEVVRVFAV